jgi:hypothetical protein
MYEYSLDGGDVMGDADMGFTVSYCADCGVRVSAGTGELHEFSNHYLCAPCHKRASTTTLPAVTDITPPPVLRSPTAVVQPASDPAMKAITGRTFHRARKLGAVARFLS